MTHGRTDRPHSSAPRDERVETAIRELQEVLADRVDDPHAKAALETLRDAFCVAHSRASLDPLTGLMNRASFDREIELLLARAERAGSEAALLFLDLDGFKAVNDQRGHPAGDCLLKEVAQRVMGCVRDDDLIARYGGDEFVVVLEPILDRAVVHAIATRIIECLSGTFTVDGMHVRLSVSVGIAMFPLHAAKTIDLIARADAAMYRAKRGGGDRYLVWSAPDDADQSGSYAKFDHGQRSSSANDIPVRRA
jgi:diguanylate cyclase (GGDEF)-like protein